VVARGPTYWVSGIRYLVLFEDINDGGPVWMPGLERL
jgi:hypothetical protein